MNVVNSGTSFQIYGESIRTFSQLPAGSYEVNFSKFTGFSLTSRADLFTNEEKVYGTHMEKVQKVIKSFELAERNFGIILSGQKGSGKSLFVKILANQMIDRGYAVVIVNTYFPGIANFLSSIEQEVLVVFDEFEKTFGKQDKFDPQEEMLTLFDGLYSGKKLFCITCNEVNRLNNYLRNRPGRFHYHFVIGNPSVQEVKDYLNDKLVDEYKNVIEQVVKLSQTADVTYDYLRAIAFEINQGYTLEESLSDLNITRTNDIFYDVVIYLEDGSIYKSYDYKLDIYDNDKSCFLRAYPQNISKDAAMTNLVIRFNSKDVQIHEGELELDPQDVVIDLDEDDYWGLSDEEAEATKERDKNRKIARISFKKKNLNFINRYLV